MTVQTAQFAAASEAFKDFPRLLNDFFGQDNLPFTFGDNNRSLITAERFKDALDALDTEHCTDENIGTIKARIDALPEGTYIDLES